MEPFLLSILLSSLSKSVSKVLATRSAVYLPLLIVVLSFAGPLMLAQNSYMDEPGRRSPPLFR
jgi:hypothetical protein